MESKFLLRNKLVFNNWSESVEFSMNSIFSFRNHIFESLPFIGTTASVEMMTEEIIKNSVNTDIAQKWLISMSFLPRPDNQMLPSLYKMFKTKHTDSDPTFVFAPTAVVHTYCRNHPNCDENEHVQQFVKLLESVTMQYLKKDLSIRANREKVHLIIIIYFISIVFILFNLE